MARQRKFELALAAALAAAIPGCAGKSMWTPWQGAKSSDTSSTSKSLDELTARNQAANGQSTGGLSGAWRKTTQSVSDALTIKPKVKPANDPTSLNSKPTKLDADLFVRAARIHESRGNFAEAESQYKKGLEKAPKDMASLVGLARLYDRQQKFADAEKLYQQAAAVDPKSALVWNDLGLCYARQKRFADASKALDKAIALQPQNKLYRNNLATVLVESRQPEAAWKHLIAVNEPAIAHYNMAYLLQKQQQSDLAAEHLRRALQANPQLTEAEEMLAQLEGRSGVADEVVVETATRPNTSYSISDDSASAAGETFVAQSGPAEIVNPLAPRRGGLQRMPATEESAAEVGSARLPAVVEEPGAAREEDGATERLELINPARRSYEQRQISHEEDSGIRQPKNIIRLLGSDAEAAPIPDEDE